MTSRLIPPLVISNDSHGFFCGSCHDLRSRYSKRMPPLTVTQLVDNINVALAVLDGVEVEGEIDEFKIIHNKWVTFQLKDEQSIVGCFMTVWQYKTAVEDGMLVRVKGRPTLRNKGFFSFVVSTIQPSGEGALKRAFELLRQRLAEEGLFSPERKRTLPRFPEHLALITSREAAAYSDFLKVLGARQGGLTISFLHTQVQGEDAPRQLIEALQYANTELKGIDVIVMVRGGGSLEDLQAFNDETVVRAVAASRTPIVVGVGHERDVTLAELAADIRASTPSNAAELVVRSREELSLAVQRLQTLLSTQVRDQIGERGNTIIRAINILRSRTQIPRQKVQLQLENLSALRQRIRQTIATRRTELERKRTLILQQIRERVRQRQTATSQLTRIVLTLSPQKTLERGYSITRTSQGKLIKLASQVGFGDELETQLRDGKVRSTVSADKQSPLPL